MSSPPLPPDVSRQLNPSSRAEIRSHIATVLAEWPLYRCYRYIGNQWGPVQKGGRSFCFPETLRLYCGEPECNTTQIWELQSGPWLGNSSTIVNMFCSAAFMCRNCKKSSVTYFLHFNVNELEGEITKVGQWPPLVRAADPVVVAGWSKEDKLLYRKALTFRNAGEGIAALPYLRRIIESHIVRVLQLLAEANQRRPSEHFDSAALENAIESRRFRDKLDFARDYLPSDLTPQGCPNPIGTIYELISEGLHELSEAECVDVFDRCKAAFEYVVKKLTEAKGEDEAYIESIRSLNKK